MRQTRRLTRAATALTLGVTPVLLLAWAGCSDGDSGGGGGTYVDPGGTYGAEITVAVSGRGRVTANLPGVDCPSACFEKYIFSSATADGAAGGVTLKAHPTSGANFLGWAFDPEPVGSRGRGPENCNPIKRAGAQPSVNTSALEITLPFGETTGTPPAGQEGACAAYTTVPTVYKVTAKFDPEAPDAGSDGGAAEILYAAPAINTTGREIGMASGRLFWMTYSSTTGFYSIYYGSTPTASALPQTATPIATNLSGVSLFEVDRYGLAFQTSLGVSFVSPSFPTTVETMTPSAGTCQALAVDTLQNVYCRTSTSIVRWPYPNYDTLQPVWSGLPSGTDLFVDTSSAFFSGTSGVYSVALSGADGGVPTPTLVAPTIGTNTGLEVGSSYMWWLQSGSLYACSRSLCTSPINAVPAAISVLPARMAEDSSSFYFWAATTTTIYRAYYTGGTQSTTFRTGLSGIYGIAADSSYVYWTSSDGAVRRTSISGT